MTAPRNSGRLAGLTYRLSDIDLSLLGQVAEDETNVAILTAVNYPSKFGNDSNQIILWKIAAKRR